MSRNLAGLWFSVLIVLFSEVEFHILGSKV